MKKSDTAIKNFKDGYACSQAVIMAFADEIGLEEELALKISSTFGGGMGRLRKTCGALTGAFMVLGMKYGNIEPNDMEKKLFSYKKVRELTAAFKDLHGTTNCGELIKKYATEYQIKARDHHKLICDRLVKDAANLLEELLYKTDNEKESA